MGSNAAAELRGRYERLLSEPVVAEAAIVHLPARVPPWTDVGVAVTAGDEVTILAAGRVVLAEALGLWGAPRLLLWGRFAPGGEVWNGTRDTTTVRGDRVGRLELGVYQGEWASRTGDLATPPDGWSYLWFLGPAEIFRTIELGGGGRAIRLDAEDDLGILRRPVDFPLSPETTLSWRWRVDALPSERAEDTLPTHDYLSVALEFENGLDLTWMWSAALPVGHHFACPLPHWNARETHWVVRSGTEQLGPWLKESRDVLADYREAIPGRAPSRVVAVWLIAVSIFGHRAARADFADIELRDGDRRLAVC